MHEHAHHGMRTELTEGHRLPLGNLPDTRYPDPRIEGWTRVSVYKQGNAAIERIATGFRWAEGRSISAMAASWCSATSPTTA